MLRGVILKVSSFATRDFASNPEPRCFCIDMVDGAVTTVGRENGPGAVRFKLLLSHVSFSERPHPPNAPDRQ